MSHSWVPLTNSEVVFLCSCGARRFISVDTFVYYKTNNGWRKIEPNHHKEMMRQIIE